MANILGFEVWIPTLGLTASSLLTIAWIFGFTIIGIIVIYFIYDYRTYRYRIILFENISGQGYQPTKKDRARVVKIGKTGEEILYLKKSKVYRSSYGRKMGVNTLWYAVGQDGYWYNCVLGDIDAKMGMLDIEVIDRDMRYTYVSVGKNIDSEYSQKKFLQEYGGLIFSGIFLIIMLGGIWFLLEEMGSIASGVSSTVEVAKALQEQNLQVISSLDNICSTSGIRSVS